MGDFLCVGLLEGCLLIGLHGVVVWEYETIFNANPVMLKQREPQALNFYTTSHRYNP